MRGAEQSVLAESQFVDVTALLGWPQELLVSLCHKLWEFALSEPLSLGLLPDGCSLKWSSSTL